MQTFAIDFTKKLYGSGSYKGLTAEQVLTGWIFWGDDWMNEPMLKIKGGELKNTLQLPDYVSANTFFNKEMGGYTIGPYVKEYYDGNHDKFNTQAIAIDDKIQLLVNLQRGVVLKIFPYTQQGKTTWLAPTDEQPQTMSLQNKRFIKSILALLYHEAEAKNYKHMDEIVGKLLKYQASNAGTSLPTANQVAAERTYNDIPFATNLFMLCLTMGFVTFMYTVARLCRKCRTGNSLDTHADIIIVWLSRGIMLRVSALDYQRHAPDDQRLRDDALRGVARAAARARLRRALPSARSVGLPYVGLLSARESHRTDGSADKAHDARAQLAAAQRACVYNNDGFRHALVHFHQRTHRPSAAPRQPNSSA